MSLRTINNHVKNLELKEQLDSSILALTSTSTISDLKNEVEVAPTSDDEAASTSEDTATTTASASTTTSPEDDLIENFGGHPKGTTAAASFDVQKSIKCSITESVQMLEELQERIERKGARIRKSALLEIIRQCKEKHNVPPHIDIKRGTIRQRLKRKSSKIGQ